VFSTDCTLFLWQFRYFPDNMNTSPSFSNRYKESTRMHVSRVPTGVLIVQLTVAVLIAGSIRLSAQDQPSKKSTRHETR